MNETSAAPTAVERAERILSRRQSIASPPAGDLAEAGSIKPEKAQADRRGRSLRQGLMRAAARSYVALALKTQKAADSVSRSWQESVEQARREQEEQIARTQGAAAARQEAAEEKRGEQTLRQAAGDTQKVTEAAGETAEAAGGAVAA